MKAGLLALAALAALLLAGLLAAFGPYDDVRSVMAPRVPLEERPASSAPEMHEVLQRIGPAGRSTYTRQLRWDLVIVAANATWLLIWLRAVARRTLRHAVARTVPVLMAAVPALADLVENAVLLRVVAAHPVVDEVLVRLAAAATTAKLLSFAAAVAVGLGLSAWVLARTLRERHAWRAP